jgi:hypothetical protein
MLDRATEHATHMHAIDIAHPIVIFIPWRLGTKTNARGHEPARGEGSRAIGPLAH